MAGRGVAAGAGACDALETGEAGDAVRTLGFEGGCRGGGGLVGMAAVVGEWCPLVAVFDGCCGEG